VLLYPYLWTLLSWGLTPQQSAAQMSRHKRCDATKPRMKVDHVILASLGQLQLESAWLANDNRSQQLN
jgi:hypothetical protein